MQFSATSGCSAGSLFELPWLQSTTIVAGRLGGGQLPLGERDAHRVVIGAPASAAQHDVRMRVAAGAEHRRLALLGDAQKMMRMAHRLQRVDRGRERAVGAVLEADRRRQAARHLAVRLGLRGARADRRPGDELGQVLRHDRVERLGARRQAQLGDVQQQLAREPHALLDVEASRRCPDR